MILTNEEIMRINQTAEFDSAIGYARKIEEAAIESYKAELLKEVGEPFGWWHQGETDDESDFYLAESRAGEDCSACTQLFTSDQLIAARKGLEEEIERLKDQLAAAQEEWNQCSGLLDDAHRSIEMLEDQLAASQLSNQQLREALEKTRGALAYVKGNGRDNPNLMESTAWHGLGAADKALAQPTSTEALDAYVAEKVKDARRTAEYWKSNHLAGNEQIATLTRHRDLAVNALEAIAGRRIFIDGLASNVDIAVMTLDAIKESEEN